MLVHHLDRDVLAEARGSPAPPEVERGHAARAQLRQDLVPTDGVSDPNHGAHASSKPAHEGESVPWGLSRTPVVPGFESLSLRPRLGV